jgi:hypothetical protein
VTGPITVFNKTIYGTSNSLEIAGHQRLNSRHLQLDIFVKNGSGGEGFNYLQFLGWVYMWGAILHWLAAIFNGMSD